MGSAWEHIIGLRTLQHIAMFFKALQVAGESRRVAGDIDDPLGLQRGEVGYDTIVQAFAGRVDDRGIGVQAQGAQPRRIGAEKVGVCDAVSRRALFCVFHRLWNNLDPGNVACGSGQAETDGTGAAVEVEDIRLGALGQRPLQDLLVNGLRLQGVHLEESLGVYFKVDAAEALTHGLAAPEGMELAGKNGVQAGFVDIQHNAGQEGAGRAQEADQGIRAAAKAAGSSNAEHRVAVGFAPEDMPDRPLSGFLTERGNTLAVHEVGDGPGRLQAALRLQKAVGYRDQIVAARAVETENRLPVPFADGENRLVAAAVDERAGVDAVAFLLLPAEAAQAVVHVLFLDGQFRRIVQMTEAAAAAGVRTGVRDAVGRGRDHADSLRPDGGIGHFQDQDLPFLARQGAGDKNSPAVEAADAVALDSTGLDENGILLVFG